LHFFIVANRAIPRMCIPVFETEQKSRRLDGDIDGVQPACSAGGMLKLLRVPMQSVLASSRVNLAIEDDPEQAIHRRRNKHPVRVLLFANWNEFGK